MTYQALETMNSTPGFNQPVGGMSDWQEAERYATQFGGLNEVGEDTYDPDGDRATAKLFGIGSDPA